VPLEISATTIVLEESKLVDLMGFESTNDKETKEFCGAPWPSKVLKGKGGNPECPLVALEKFFILAVVFGASL
jgi:hypothetical protein